MYSRPHLIWVAGLVRQSPPALAILEPGNACGMPYAPLGFAALTRQPLSWFHIVTRQLNWSSPQPRASSIVLAIACADPGVTEIVWVGVDEVDLEEDDDDETAARVVGTGD